MRIKLQDNIRNCGLCCLQSMHKKYFKKWIDINFLSQEVNYSDKGISINELIRLGKTIGLILEPLKGNYQSFLKLKNTEPMILLLKNNGYFHYVILQKRTENYFVLLDPAKGRIILTINELEQQFTGILIKISPIKGFQYSHYEKSVIDLDLISIKKYFFIFILSLILQATFFASSFYFKLIIDKVWGFANYEFLFKLTIIFIWINIVKILASFLINLLKKRIVLKIWRNLLEQIYEKIMFCQLKNKENLNIGEFIQRIESVPVVANFQTNIFILISINSICSLAMIVIMNFISWRLFLIGFSFIFSNFLISFIFKNKLKRFYNYSINQNIEIMNKNIEIFNNFIESKNSSNQKYNFEIYQRKIDTFFKLNNKFLNKNNIRAILKQAIQNFSNLMIIFIGSYLSIKTSLTLGNLLLFTSFFSYLNSPIETIIEIMYSWETNQIFVSKIRSILDWKDEEEDSYIFNEKIEKIEFFNVGLSKGNKKIINNLSFDSTSHMILSGKNGSGKTTIYKLIYKLYKPNTGEIFINEKNLSYFNSNSWRNHVFINNNDLNLRNDTILSIITNNEPYRVERFCYNFQKYNLEQIFKRFNLYLDRTILRSDTELSSGQKQLINIMSLFTKKYKLILLDEAFENIENEAFDLLKLAIKEVQDEAFFIEISHNNKFIKNGKEIKLI
ncbi:Mbov_0121 family peptidase domain-containing ABC transporter [[Mycoplasma] anseris]|uniref:ATP-binding cassette domain-containing protein n=1 Tax=[Mycoplasma] anseris TaxID=92400 RepID=A0A2Z4ND54_9BACT|nr:cysteine peptidase family C39 domain-containing protein [[Mycoplasma] anseris]AWX69503.1 ATP-binding cassette domain-containing protein [[Mycoplasma] anseris]